MKTIMIATFSMVTLATSISFAATGSTTINGNCDPSNPNLSVTCNNPAKSSSCKYRDARIKEAAQLKADIKAGKPVQDGTTIE